MGFFIIEHIFFQEQKGSISQAHLPQLSPADFDVSSAEQSRGRMAGGARHINQPKQREKWNKRSSVLFININVVSTCIAAAL